MNSAFKKMIIGLTISVAVFTGMLGVGFAGHDNHDGRTAYVNQSAGTAHRELEKDNSYNESDDDYYDGTEEDYYEPLTLEEYLGIDYEKLDDNQKSQLQKQIDKINNFEFKDDDTSYEKYEALFDELDQTLEDMGFAVPYSDLGDFALSQKDKIGEADYNTLLKLDEKINELNEKLEKLYESEIFKKADDLNSQIQSTYEQIDDILLKNDLNPEEVYGQIGGSGAILALFDVEQGSIKLSDRSIKGEEEITNKDMDLYQKLWDHAKLIIPSDYIEKITKFEINTDGYQNVMAHVISESTDQSKWRLALDIKDSLNSDGSFNEEIDNTIIHEFMHVITLNDSQLKDKVDPYSGTYTVDEGTLREGSYLNKFYNKFWKSLEDEFNESLAANEDEDSYGDNAFYEKYKDHFVSDYAATNPVEDIAETFRVFVMEEAPIGGDQIKDKKVLFFYSFDELVKFRSEIRANLGLK